MHLGESQVRVLAMNLELCTLHLHETTDLEEILSFLLFGDGCAAALISADPVGVRMASFKAALVPDTAGLIRWNIREQGFDVLLMLEATIGLNEVEADAVESDTDDEAAEGPFTRNDLTFLKSLRISLTE